MSIPLDLVDMSAVQVGAIGRIDWTGKAQPGNPYGVRSGTAHVRILNESGAGLKIMMNGSASGFHLAAGGWQDVPLSGENFFTWECEYFQVGPSPNALLVTLYQPGEPMPPPPILGNSPVGIGGVVNTATTPSIKNDGNAPATSIVEATPSDQASSSVSLNNDASGFLKVLSANVLRTILNVVRGNSGAGKAAIQLGDSGDTSITTIYGTVGAGSIVPPATLAAGALPAGVTIPGAQVSSAVANATSATSATDAGTVGAAMTGRDDPTNHFYGPSPAVKPATIPRGLNVEVWDGAASHFPSLLDGAGNWLMNIPGSAVSSAVASAQKLIGASQTDGFTSQDDSVNKITRLNPTATVQRDIAFQYVNAANTQVVGPTISTLSAVYHVPGQWRDAPSSLQYPIATTFFGTGAGTYAHAMAPLGVTPRAVFICPNQANSTETIGVDTLGSTSVHVNSPNAWPFYGLAVLC